MPKLLIACLFVSFLLYSCGEQGVFEKDMDIPSYAWNQNDTLRFEVAIEDNEPKNLYVNVRHRFEFEWRNIWVNMKITFPNDSVYTTPINIPLSQPDGHWFGECSGDICNLQFPIERFTSFGFEQTGIYLFEFNQEMREDPLTKVMSFGMRLENTVKE